MTAQDKVLNLKKQIEETLTPLVDNDYVLLDLPYHSNLGDTLIWQGELDFLKKTPYKCKYSTWIRGGLSEIGKWLKQDTLLLFNGGGNFGDVWYEQNELRKRVIAMYPNYRSVVFPQTVYYSDEKNLQDDVAFYSKHPNVTICARDSRSFQLLRERFPKNRSILVPDMAFYMDLSRYKRNMNPKGSVFVKRDDIEFKEELQYCDVPKDALVTDWRWLDNSKEYLRLNTWEKKDKIFSILNKISHADVRNMFINKYWHHCLRPLNVKTAIEFIDQFERVFATRMHAALLAVILSKKDITLFDNSYGKSSSLYDTWFTDVDGFKMIR